MRPIKKAKRKDTDVGKKIIRTTTTVELCGECKKTLNKYWSYCPYCGEHIEREVQA